MSTIVWWAQLYDEHNFMMNTIFVMNKNSNKIGCSSWIHWGEEICNSLPKNYYSASKASVAIEICRLIKNVYEDLDSPRCHSAAYWYCLSASGRSVVIARWLARNRPEIVLFLNDWRLFYPSASFFRLLPFIFGRLDSLSHRTSVVDMSEGHSSYHFLTVEINTSMSFGRNGRLIWVPGPNFKFTDGS